MSLFSKTVEGILMKKIYDVKINENIFLVSMKFLFNQKFWRKKLFTDYCEFRKIRMITNFTRDIPKKKRANDLKI